MTSPAQIITMSRHDSPADSFSGHERAPSDDGSWHYMDMPSDASSVAILGSPASGSLVSYGVVVHRGRGHRGPSHSPAMNKSPEALPLQLPPTSSPTQLVGDRQGTNTNTTYAGSSYMMNQVPMSFASQMSPADPAVDVPGMAASTYAHSHFSSAVSEPATDIFPEHLVGDTLLMGMDTGFNGLTGFFSDGLAPPPTIHPALQPAQNQAHQQQQHQPQQQSPYQGSFDIQAPPRSSGNVAGWDITSNPEPQQAQMFAMDGFGLDSMSPTSVYTPVSAGTSMSHASASPRSPAHPHIEAMDQPAPELQLTPLQQLQLEQLQQEMLQFQRTQQQQKQQQQQRQNHQHQQAQHLHESQFHLSLQTGPIAVPAASMSVHAQPAITTPTEFKHSPTEFVSKPTPARSAPTSINKVRGTGTRVVKKRTTSQSSSLQLSGSLGSSSGDDKFVIFTPKTISTHAVSGNRFNAFECFEAMSASQKGRKGPLAEEVKESALQVRRAGACFCCHSRKVKCDAQLPCKNCVKLATHMPQAICWRFDDFLSPLFPTMIREHFGKAEMAAFISENVGSYSDSGPFTISLCSGPFFKTTLDIRHVKLFNPAPRAIVMQHTRLTTGGGQARLSSENSIPLGLDMSESSAVSATLQQDKIKKALRAYVEGILKEDAYVETMTGNITQTEVPKKVLAMVRRFWLKTSAPIVKQALYIYTLQFIMMHHLTLTAQTLQSLPLQGVMLSDSPFQTARLLNRQIKVIVDEMMQEDVDKLFRMFARELKPKARSAWATCLAAFLVFCLFMEMTGLSFDYFVIADNEAKLQNNVRMDPRHKRAKAIKMSRELENLPFRQFALQFHNIYQTHQTTPNSAPASSSSSSSSPPSSAGSGAAGSSSAVKSAFNPLVDDGPLLSGDLDKHANEFTKQLRTLLDGDNWHELDFLSYNDLIDSTEDYPMPRDVSMDYTGRLCSKFLLSFQRETYIYTPA